MHVTIEGTGILSCQRGISLIESVDSAGFLMNVSLDGNANSNLFSSNTEFDVYLEGCNDDIDAESNQWVTTDSSQIEARIWHKNDDPALGLVAFSSFKDHGPELRVDGIFKDTYSVFVTHVGLPNQTANLFMALGTGSLPTPFGELQLDPLTFKYLISLPTGPIGLSSVAG